MTNLETNLLEVVTRKAVRFCSRAVRLFPALLGWFLKITDKLPPHFCMGDPQA